jgi:hypothetical protein
MEIFLCPERATSETHAHKTTYVPVFFIWALGLNDFDGDKFITRAFGNILKDVFGP